MERADWETYWRPVLPGDVREMFRGHAGRWWIAGGWAIDLLAGEPYREHADIDVEVLRPEVHLIHAALPGWEIFGCQWPDGDILHRWQPGEPLPDSVHDFWCRPAAGAPWALQLMVLDVDPDDARRWLFRRDHRIGGRIADLTLARDGYPLLAPEVQLLFKSKGRLEKDERDLARAWPLLDRPRRQWLFDALAVTDPGNPWLSRLGSQPDAPV